GGGRKASGCVVFHAVFDLDGSSLIRRLMRHREEGELLHLPFGRRRCTRKQADEMKATEKINFSKQL
uniref:Uncharacterized protein n=1 Tax=Oryza brachyantha TaxID=4533 RepID=J3M3X8_ORYBR